MDNGQLPDKKAPEPRPSIRALTIEGFKSIGEKREIHFRPLTILAGANSSGKSSAIQPLLLLKQTLEAPYDPGALLLHGPNVQFTSTTQLLTHQAGQPATSGEFGVGIALDSDHPTVVYFGKETAQPIRVNRIISIFNNNQIIYRFNDLIRTNDILQILIKYSIYNQLYYNLLSLKSNYATFSETLCHVIGDRCFVIGYLRFLYAKYDNEITIDLVPRSVPSAILACIHVPGLRGSPRRNYSLTAVGERFPGTFDVYVASVIAEAQRRDNRPFLDQLATDLRELGLTSHIRARSVDDAQVELRVGRLPTRTGGSADDLVSIADVGIGVSQTLPLVVALLTAKPGQFVYIEQPELHLHPRAQHAMARLLGRAATRGVQVVIETHSSILLLGVQGLVAKGELDPGRVILHWFTRDEETGQTNIASADLDAAGRFGDWPEDFDDVTLDAQQQYLDAAEKKIAP